jgi:nucleotide-binding universal stress UspA family protein
MHLIPKRILAATDFSETADSAVALAVDLARAFHAHLHLLHAAIILEDQHLESHRRTQLDELLTASDAARRRELEENYESQHGIDVTPHVVRGMAPSEVIVESANSFECDLIVMGTHGRRGLSHLILGSVAERVVRTSKKPVLTVRADAAVDTSGIRNILVPYDFSEASSGALQHARAWADAFDAELTLMHVVEPVVYPEFYAVDVVSDHTMERLIERSREALDKVAEDVADSRVTTRVDSGRAATKIVEAADPENFDFVIMATRGLTGLEHVLLGSVAETVLRQCRIPMLSVSGG